MAYASYLSRSNLVVPLSLSISDKYASGPQAEGIKSIESTRVHGSPRIRWTSIHFLREGRQVTKPRLRTRMFLSCQEALTRRSSTSTISDGLRECMHTPRRLRPRQLPQPVYSKPQNEAFHQQKLKTNQAHALQTRTRLPLSQSQISSWSFARACEL